MKMHITRSAFEAIFEACMKVDHYESNQVDDEGTIYSHGINVTPSMTIRTYVDDFTDCDEEEFTDESEAWEYFLTTRGLCRIIDASGKIYLDCFD